MLVGIFTGANQHNGQGNKSTHDVCHVLLGFNLSVEEELEIAHGSHIIDCGEFWGSYSGGIHVYDLLRPRVERMMKEAKMRAAFGRNCT